LTSAAAAILYCRSTPHQQAQRSMYTGIGKITCFRSLIVTRSYSCRLGYLCRIDA